MILSTLNSSNIVNQTLLADIKQSNDIRYENEQLKKEIELLKSANPFTQSSRNILSLDSFRLKCNDRIVHEEELRTLRQRVHQGEDYRAIIAKKDVEIEVREDLLAHEVNVFSSRNFANN